MKIKLLCYILLAFFSIMICASCYSPKNKVKKISTFPITKTLKIKEQISLDSVFMSYPIMKIDGSYCCIADMNASGQYFHIFKFPSFEYIKSIGKKGKASNEISTLTDFDFCNGIITALCGNESQIKTFNIHNVNNPLVIRLNEDYCYSSVCDGGDGTYYLYTMTGGNRIIKVDSIGNIIARGLTIEPLKKEFPSMTSNYVWQGFIRKHGKTVVVPTKCGDVIDILYSSLDTYLRIEGKFGIPYVKESVSNGISSYMLQYHTYSDVFLTDNIYALLTYEDLSKYPKGKITNCIRVLDYNGTPQKELMFDKELEPSSLYVDELTKTIYLLLPESDKPIWIYEL